MIFKIGSRFGCEHCKELVLIGESHVVYDNDEFIKACSHDNKEASSSSHKKHAKTAYLSCLADVKRAENKKYLILLKEKEFNLQMAQQERASKFEDSQEAEQAQLTKMHTDL